MASNLFIYIVMKILKEYRWGKLAALITGSNQQFLVHAGFQNAKCQLVVGKGNQIKQTECYLASISPSPYKYEGSFQLEIYM